MDDGFIDDQAVAEVPGHPGRTDRGDRHQGGGYSCRPDQSLDGLFDERAALCNPRADLAIHCDGLTGDRVRDPAFKDIFHATWSPRYQRHGLYMIALPTAGHAGPILGENRVRPLTDFCLHEILHVFSRDEHRALFESVGRDGRVIDEPEGRLLNPGHALESMGFCMEAGLKRGDRAVVERCVSVIDGMYERGDDREHGGIVSFVDLSRGRPPQTDWHKETGVAGDDKVWWVHAEALYALALAALQSRSRPRFDRFLDLHEWTRTGPPLLARQRGLSEASINRLGDEWIVCLRTNQRDEASGKDGAPTGWTRTADPFVTLGEPVYVPVPCSWSPRVAYACPDGVLRVFCGDINLSPYGLKRNPLYAWDVDPGNFSVSNRRVVFDACAAGLPLRTALVDYAPLFPAHDGRQLLSFRVTVPNETQESRQGPAVRNEEIGPAGAHLADIVYDRPVPGPWQFPPT